MEHVMQRLIILTALCAGFVPLHSHAQWVPKMPIRIVVPFDTAGGAN